jgi:hypothetical protein
LERCQPPATLGSGEAAAQESLAEHWGAAKLRFKKGLGRTLGSGEAAASLLPSFPVSPAFPAFPAFSLTASALALAVCSRDDKPTIAALGSGGSDRISRKRKRDIITAHLPQSDLDDVR